jgi:hypothetical protein
MSRRILAALALACRLVLAAFFAFVGYWKALGPFEALAEHHAWVAGFPAWFARTVGWSELACAMVLAASVAARLHQLAYWTAIVLALNQLAALWVHLARGEGASAGPQNLVILAMLALVALHARRAAPARATAMN